jgi:Arc/MetJ-type ribon-helix-helix transcriptional regulator
MHTISVKLPASDIRRIPRRNRSAFVREAVREKLTQGEPPPWQPKTALGRKLNALRTAHVASGAKLLTADEVAEEIRQRRGGLA